MQSFQLKEFSNYRISNYQRATGPKIFELCVSISISNESREGYCVFIELTVFPFFTLETITEREQRERKEKEEDPKETMAARESKFLSGRSRERDTRVTWRIYVDRVSRNG